MRRALKICLAAISCALILFSSAALCSDGFFTIDKKYDRWWFFDPDGNVFFSTGVCHVTPYGFYSPPLGHSPYYENIMDIYGSVEVWAEVAFERLKKWNFNTLVAWSDLGLLGDKMPYALNLSLSGADWQQGTIPDFFADAFYNRVAQVVEGAVVPRVDDPNLLGYFLDNEMRWGPDWRAVRDLFADYFSFDATSPGKIALVNFLRERYDDDVEAFNEAWGMSLSSFDDLFSMTEIIPIPLTPAQKADRAAFTGIVAEHFYKYCHDAIRAADPNHLILGSRFVSWVTPLEVLNAIVPYTDVVSVNHYLPWLIYEPLINILREMFGWTDVSDMLKEFYELTQKPILITEFSIRAFDSGLPNTYPYYWFFTTLQTQQDRADFFERYARETFATEYIVGYHWFCYQDEPPEGRFDGENSNFGLVSNMDEPWELLVERMTEVNADWPVPDDDADDDTEDDDDTDDDTADDKTSSEKGCGC